MSKNSLESGLMKFGVVRKGIVDLRIVDFGLWILDLKNQQSKIKNALLWIGRIVVCCAEHSKNIAEHSMKHSNHSKIIASIA